MEPQKPKHHTLPKSSVGKSSTGKAPTVTSSRCRNGTSNAKAPQTAQILCWKVFNEQSTNSDFIKVQERTSKAKAPQTAQILCWKVFNEQSTSSDLSGWSYIIAQLFSQSAPWSSLLSSMNAHSDSSQQMQLLKLSENRKRKKEKVGLGQQPPERTPVLSRSSLFKTFLSCALW